MPSTEMLEGLVRVVVAGEALHVTLTVEPGWVCSTWAWMSMWASTLPCWFTLGEAEDLADEEAHLRTDYATIAPGVVRDAITPLQRRPSR